VTELVNENLCLSLGYSGDVIQAQRTAEAAGKPSTSSTACQGTTVWMDTMAIPADAKHPEYAYRFINFVMRPENMAAISNFTGYPTASAKARQDARHARQPRHLPRRSHLRPADSGKDIPQADMRARMRVWTRFKTAQD
jgi:putrescine transport system substrate-binding protein